MSSVRVLVGTHKGAFILTADGKREKWEVSGPHFAGWEMYHLKGSPVDPEPDLCVPNQRMVRPDHPALERWRKDLGDAGWRKNAHAGRHASGGEQQIRLRYHRGNGQTAYHSYVV